MNCSLINAKKQQKAKKADVTGKTGGTARFRTASIPAVPGDAEGRGNIADARGNCPRGERIAAANLCTCAAARRAVVAHTAHSLLRIIASPSGMRRPRDADSFHDKRYEIL